MKNYTVACTNQELGIDNNNRLQVCVQNQWMTICERGDKWDVHAANVACKQMGYNDNGEFDELLEI